LLLSRVLSSIVLHTLEALQDVEAIVGMKIQELRKKKGFTQDQFAVRAGLNRTHLYRLESGRQSITLRTLKIVADALEIRVRDLVRDV
jgi:transcriptional regulator with XRE-family HTH domain